MRAHPQTEDEFIHIDNATHGRGGDTGGLKGVDDVAGIITRRHIEQIIGGARYRFPVQRDLRQTGRADRQRPRHRRGQQDPALAHDATVDFRDDHHIS